MNLAAIAFVVLLGAAPTGGIYVTTLPAGADVWIDGAYLGRSPVVVDAVGAGAHRLTLTRTGWTPQDVGVTVIPATTITESVVLSRDGKGSEPGGIVALHGPHVGAVTVDGESVALDREGTFAASTGTHEVTLTVPQGKITRTVTVYPQTRTDVVLTDTAATRSVVIAPADVYLHDGTVRVDGATVLVHYGRHDVTAHLGSDVYAVDNRTMTFDVPPTIIKNRVYLPLELLNLLTANDKS